MARRRPSDPTTRSTSSPLSPALSELLTTVKMAAPLPHACLETGSADLSSSATVGATTTGQVPLGSKTTIRSPGRRACQAFA